MKTLSLFVLLSLSFFNSKAQFTASKSEAFMGAEKLLKKAGGEAYYDGMGYLSKIVNIKFSENEIIITQQVKSISKGQKYMDATDTNYSKLYWKGLRSYHFWPDQKNKNIKRVHLEFDRDLQWISTHSKNPYNTNSLDLYIKAKDEQEMEKYIQSIRHYAQN